MKKILLFNFIWLTLFSTNCKNQANINQADFIKTFYVSTTGNNNNNGSKDSPWKTINYAINKIKPGERVIITSGKYIEEIFPTVSGRAEDFITIEGAGKVEIISSNSYKWSTCITLENVSFLKFKNLHFSGANYTNILLNDESLTGQVNNITFENITSNESFVGISFSGVIDSTIKNSSFHDNQFNIELVKYNENILIDNNKVYNTSIKKPEFEGHWSHNITLYSTGESGKLNRYIKITNNEIYNSYMQGILAYRSQNVLIEGNHCYNNGATGIQVESDDSREEDRLSKNIIVQNNICNNNSNKYESEAGIWIDDTINSVIRNNQIYGNERGLIISGSLNSAAYNNYIYNNSHNKFINSSGLVVTSSMGQSDQMGVESSNILIFNNSFINNGGNSQRAQILLGYYENDKLLPLSNVVFKNNIVAETSNTNQYKLDLQGFAYNSYIDFNQYYNSNRKSKFFWQMNRDPWGDYSEDPYILNRIPDHDINSSFNKNNIITGTYLTKILNVSKNKTMLTLENVAYFSSGFGLIQGDYIVIDNKEYLITNVNYKENIITISPPIHLKSDERVNLKAINYKVGEIHKQTPLI